MTIGLLDPTGWTLIGGAVGVLVIASVVSALLRRKLTAERHHSLITNLRQRIAAWWVMIGVLTAALAAGRITVVILFALLSFLALREFITISPATARDHQALVWLFFVAVPAQYLLVGIEWYGLFAILIPVYAFLFLPTRSALVGDTTNFLQRAAVIQWALMVCVYCLSYLPAIPQLAGAVGRAHGGATDDASVAGLGGRLLLFVVLVVQGSDVLQYVWGKTLGKHPIAPTVSPNKTWEGFIGGVLSATVLGTCLWWVTTLAPWEAAILAFISCLMGFAGGLVMSAIKRDRGIKDFGALIPGHGGIMDRLDSLVFAAPVFFHLTRYFFT